MGEETLIPRVLAAEPSAKVRDDAGGPSVEVAPDRLFGLMQCLRDRPDLAFDMLMAHTAVDWLEQGRFELVYILYSTVHGHGLTVCASVPRDKPVAPTLSGLWPIAHWQEREVFDLMGVLYDGHPDLRRVFLEDDWQGYPLRKDYQDSDMLELPQ